MARRIQVSGARPARFATVLMAATLAATLAAACHTAPRTVDVADYDHTKRHPILVGEEPEVLDLPIGMHPPHLSPEVAHVVHAFVADYRHTGTGALTIQVPSASANEVAAATAADEARRLVLRAGVPPSRVRMAPYHVGDPARLAPVRLAFLKLKANAPQCGLWPEDLGADSQNRNYFNFGCANQANLAAMVADPGDLLAARPTDPASGARRAKVIQDYSQGNETRSNTELLGSDFGGL